MTTNTTSALVLKDGEGTYYLLTPELLDQARVPAEKVAELEAIMQSDDTAGFSLSAFDPAFTGGSVAGPPAQIGVGFRLLGALPTAPGLKAGSSEV